MYWKTVISLIAGAALLVIAAVLNQTPAVAQTAADVTPGPETLAEEILPEPLICIDCHRAPNINTNEGVLASQSFCLDCHREPGAKQQKGSTKKDLQVTLATFHQNQPTHKFTACIHCHTDVAQSPHKTKTFATCQACHTPHSEGPANAPHLRVSCQSCHFKSAFVRLDPEDHRIKLSHTNDDGVPISLSDHAMADVTDEQTCRKCHVAHNTVGAPSAVLPSKSALCIVCHTAPLAVGNPVFGLAGLIFMGGIFIMLAFWFKGSVQGEEDSLNEKISLVSESVWKTIFSKQVFGLVKIFVLDIVLQRRILKESVSRWSMHALIFTAILLRFGLSLFTAMGSYFSPEGELMMALVDKNHWFTAFANDLLGLCILLGIAWALVKRFVAKPDHVVSEYQDTAALGIMGSLVLLGFFLEGARILVTQIPVEIAGYSFVGIIFSGVFSLLPLDWAAVYPWMWYAHGVVGAVFVAYLPFGKMRHMFNTPLTYFIEAVDGVKNEKRV